MKLHTSLRSLLLALSLSLFAVQYASAQAPDNDNLANRTVLIGADLNEFGTNVNATGEPGEFDQGFDDDTGTASVWYEWTAPSTGSFVLNTFGSVNAADASDLDTNVGIFTSDSPNPTTHDQLNVFVINDDGYDDTPFQSCVVIFLAIEGTTYYISIDTFSDVPDHPQGSIALSISPGPQRPANDDLATAEVLSPTLPVSTTGTNVNATRELEEPFYDNLASFASLWYQWTPSQSRPVKIDFSGTDYNIITAVYTGTTYASLVEQVVDFGNTIYLDAVAGTTYSIVVDGTYPFFQENGTLNLSIRPNTDVPIINFGSSWQYFHPTTGINPAIADPDYDSTWQLGRAAYNGPLFSTGVGLFGYGTINFTPVVTDIGTPAEGIRYTAYFRKQIEVNENVSNVSVRALVDDGAAFYLNGTIVHRENYSAEPDSYLQLSDGVGDEGDLVQFDFPDLPAGDHVISVSLHNQAINSSDLGFDMEMVYEPAGLGPSSDSDGDGASDEDEAIAGTDPNDSTDVFKILDSSVAVTGTYSVEWTSVAGKNYSLEFSLDPATPSASWVLLDVVVGGGGTDSLAGVLPGGSPATGFLRVKVN